MRTTTAKWHESYQHDYHRVHRKRSRGINNHQHSQLSLNTNVDKRVANCFNDTLTAITIDSHLHFMPSHDVNLLELAHSSRGSSSSPALPKLPSVSKSHTFLSPQTLMTLTMCFDLLFVYDCKRPQETQRATATLSPSKENFSPLFNNIHNILFSLFYFYFSINNG